ncbi:MAG: hypothetical protein K6F00_04965 [Lachnospiraceae bacterium]|nr:hypothetical protein [Lachnospiraceae bacterium]
MAQKLCQLKKKGGGSLTETDLWTNSAPSSAWASSSITLSQSISNFTFIKIYYKPTKDSSNTDINAICVEVEALKKMTDAVGKCQLFPTAKLTSSALWGRRAWYNDDTTMGVNNTGTQIYAANTSTSNIIFTKVCGLK